MKLWKWDDDKNVQLPGRAHEFLSRKKGIKNVRPEMTFATPMAETLCVLPKKLTLTLMISAVVFFSANPSLPGKQQNCNWGAQDEEGDAFSRCPFVSKLQAQIVISARNVKMRFHLYSNSVLKFLGEHWVQMSLFKKWTLFLRHSHSLQMSELGLRYLVLKFNFQSRV